MAYPLLDRPSSGRRGTRGVRAGAWRRVTGFRVMCEPGLGFGKHRAFALNECPEYPRVVHASNHIVHLLVIVNIIILNYIKNQNRLPHRYSHILEFPNIRHKTFEPY